MLRPYQEEARVAIEGEWANGRRKTLLVLPTGCGKTVVFSAVAEDEVKAGGNVLILAHRGELLDQAADKLMAFSNLDCAVEKAEQTSEGASECVTVGSVQSMMGEKRLERFAPDHYSAIIVDEAHHAIAASYQKVLGHFPQAKVLGVTATPDRSDKKSLGKVFDSIAYEYQLLQAVRDGYLSPIKALSIPLDIDLTNVRVTAGDYNDSDLDEALDPYLEAIADAMADKCQQRKTVVFLPLVSTSQRFCEMLKARGMEAYEVNGNSPDRKEVLEAFDKAGKGSVICNSMLLTEGWDCPTVDCVCVLRPTRSRALYAQMVGRGTRPAPGKSELLLLDFLWLTGKHQLCRPASLVASSDDVAKRMTDKVNAADGMVDLEEAMQAAEHDVVAEREKKLAQELKAARRSKSKLVNPLQYEMSIDSADLATYEPQFAWEMAPASEKQLALIEGRGIDPAMVTCAGQASKIIDKLIARQKAGLATPKQIRCLEKFGFANVDMWHFEDANNMISRLAQASWKVWKLEQQIGAVEHYKPQELVSLG